MLYLIGGNNTYRSKRRLDGLVKEFNKRFDGILQVYNADEVDDYNSIITDAESLSLFHKEKLIVIKRLFSAKSIVVDNFHEYLKKVGKTNLILWEDKPIDKRRGLYKHIKRKGVVEEYENLKYYQLSQWIRSFLQKKVEYEDRCVDELVFKVGSDQEQLEIILDNLVELVQTKKTKVLKVEDINAFVARTTEEDLWDLIDSLGEYNKQRALKILDRVYTEPYDFVKIIGMLTRQFRIIAMIKYMIKVGKNQRDLYKQLGLHPFVIKKAIIHSRNYSFQKIRKIYHKLLKTDLVVKQGLFEGKLALDLFVTAL